MASKFSQCIFKDLVLLGKKMNNKVFHYIIRAPKSEAAFIYFQLEANDGICFYSTLKDSLGQGYRDLDIKGDQTLHQEFLNILNKLKETINIEILQNNGESNG